MTTVAAAWHSGRMVPGHTPGQQEPDPREFEGYDLHVLRNTSSLPLRSVLVVGEDNGNIVRADGALPADVVGFVFFPEFAGLAAPGNALDCGGVRFVPQTGVVTALANPPTPRLRSFLVRVQVLRQGNPPLAGPPLRVHIHESVTEIWLTPSPLTIAGDADGQRLTVLARFDDDTVGDITRLASAPPGAGLPPHPGFQWASNDNVCVQPDAQGRLTGVFGLFACTATITATLQQPGWPALSATAEVTVVEPWGEPPPGRAELHLVSGPGETVVADVPNILLLPDGFLDTPADRDDFQALASLAVQRLNRSPSTTPFDVLEGAINYWTAFVPSREGGTSTLDDHFEEPTLFEGTTQAARTPVTQLTVDGQRAAGDQQIDFRRATLDGRLPAGVHFTVAGDPTLYTTANATAAQANALRGVRFAPPLAQIAGNGAAVTIIGRRIPVPRGQRAVAGAAGAWTMDNLVHVVGLPVPAERLAQGSTPQQLNAKIGDWTTLYGTRIEAARITHVLFDAWARLLPDHRLADEKDTAFGLACGERPRADVRATEQVITWHPLRTLRTDVDRFLALLSFRGTLIGPTWTVQPGGADAKDRNLVFVLARGARYSGANRSGRDPIVGMGLVDDLNIRVRHGAGRRMLIVSHPLSRDRANVPAVTNFVHATIAHEAAHSFALLDEYGGAPAMPPGGQDEQRTFEFGNVTPAREVAAGQAIVGERLRWRWPRITSAGVLASRPVPDPVLANAFTIRLDQTRRLGNLRGDLFNVGDVVFLRQRPLLRRSTANPPVLTPALESPPLRIFEMPSDSELRVSIVGGGSLTPGDFADTGVRAPILFRPQAASAVAAAAGDRYAEVMAQFIRRHITTSGGPLNAPPNAPQQACVPAVPPLHMEPQRATNLPPAATFPGGTVPALPSQIIGAYEGGAAFSCGVFHPSGVCIMRTPLATRTEQAITQTPANTVHGFCHVCRYLIVDSIEPRAHFMIDFFYRLYPQP